MSLPPAQPLSEMFAQDGGLRVDSQIITHHFIALLSGLASTICADRVHAKLLGNVHRRFSGPRQEGLLEFRLRRRGSIVSASNRM